MQGRLCRSGSQEAMSLSPRSPSFEQLSPRSTQEDDEEKAAEYTAIRATPSGSYSQCADSTVSYGSERDAARAGSFGYDSRSCSTEVTSPTGHLSKAYSEPPSEVTAQDSLPHNATSDSSHNHDNNFHNEHQRNTARKWQALAPPNLDRPGPQTRQNTKDTIAATATTTAPLSPHRRGRVPGGAAAKLMLLGPQPSEEDHSQPGTLATTSTATTATTAGGGGGVNCFTAPCLIPTAVDTPTTSTAEHDHPPLSMAPSLSEIDREMQRAKEEFQKGSVENRRYHHHPLSTTLGAAGRNTAPASVQLISDRDSEVSATPSFIARSEVFHETAAAAVVALLKPRERLGSSTTAGTPGSTSRAAAAVTNTRMDQMSVQHEVLSVYSGTDTTELRNNLTLHTIKSNEGLVDSASYESPFKRDIDPQVLSATTERHVESIKAKMRPPNKATAELLDQIASPESSERFELGYMVRRKNACGALQLLTTKPANRIPLNWMLGVLPALTSVLVDGGAHPERLLEIFPDQRIRSEYKAARDRAIAALMNLAVPKVNRIAIFHTPSLVPAMIEMIQDDDEGTAMRGCCTVLAFLAKTPENRRLMALVPGLLDALTKVLAPRKKRFITVTKVVDSPSSRSRSSVDSDQKPTDSSMTIQESRTGYDDGVDDFVQQARQNAFALLHHLIKEKDNAYLFARATSLLWTLVDISKHMDSPSHVLALKVLAHLTRHRLNTNPLVFSTPFVVPALVLATDSPDDEARLYTCYALQNIAQDKSCRQELANTEHLIVALCSRARDATIETERLAAVSALKNLCDEPANLIPITNAPDGVSTLMHLAHDEEGVSEMIRYIACDALATLSHWLRKIATSGQILDARQHGRPQPEGMFVPSLRVVTWNQWQ